MGNLSTENDGFSLLELLVAIAILSLAVIPMLSSQSSALKNMSGLNDQALAQIVAENVLTELRLSEVPPAVGFLSGEGAQAQVSFTWKAEIRNLPGQPLMTILLTVAKPDDPEPIYQITGFRGKL